MDESLSSIKTPGRMKTSHFPSQSWWWGYSRPSTGQIKYLILFLLNDSAICPSGVTALTPISLHSPHAAIFTLIGSRWDLKCFFWCNGLNFVCSCGLYILMRQNLCSSIVFVICYMIKPIALALNSDGMSYVYVYMCTCDQPGLL